MIKFIIDYIKCLFFPFKSNNVIVERIYGGEVSLQINKYSYKCKKINTINDLNCDYITPLIGNDIIMIYSNENEVVYSKYTEQNITYKISVEIKNE